MSRGLWRRDERRKTDVFSGQKLKRTVTNAPTIEMSDEDFRCEDCGQEFSGETGYAWHRTNRAPSCARARARTYAREGHDQGPEPSGVPEGLTTVEDDFTAGGPEAAQSPAAAGGAGRTAAEAVEIEVAAAEARGARREQERLEAAIASTEAEIRGLRAEKDQLGGVARRAEQALRDADQVVEDLRVAYDQQLAINGALEAKVAALRTTLLDQEAHLKKRALKIEHLRMRLATRTRLAVDARDREVEASDEERNIARGVAKIVVDKGLPGFIDVERWDDRYGQRLAQLLDLGGSEVNKSFDWLHDTLRGEGPGDPELATKELVDALASFILREPRAYSVALGEGPSATEPFT